MDNDCLAQLSFNLITETLIHTNAFISKIRFDTVIMPKTKMFLFLITPLDKELNRMLKSDLCITDQLEA